MASGQTMKWPKGYLKDITPKMRFCVTIFAPYDRHKTQYNQICQIDKAGSVFFPLQQNVLFLSFSPQSQGVPERTMKRILLFFWQHQEHRLHYQNDI